MDLDSNDIVDKILSDERALQILNEQSKRKHNEDGAETEQTPKDTQAPEPSGQQAQPEPTEPEPVQEQAEMTPPPQQEPGCAEAEAAAAPEPSPAAGPEPAPAEELMDQDAAMAEVESAHGQLREGDIVEGTVVAVSAEGVLVDVGTKCEGLIPAHEFAEEGSQPAVGEVLDVYIVRPEDEEGNILLSKKRADYENVWRRVLSAYETGEVITAMVTDRVKGGLRVDLGVQGFVPASHVGARRLRDIDGFVGRSLRLKVIEADRDSKKVILSHRIVVEEERQARKEETLNSLQEGQVVTGRVRNITNYGAFVDLGGVDGLLHISEMAWTRIKHPSEVLNVGDTIQVMVLRIDREKERISLGRRQILPDPWKEAPKRYKVGEIVPARITRVVQFGAFAALESGIEGIIPTSELAEKRVSDPAEVVQVGQQVEVKILNLRPQERRATLSLIEASRERERQEYREYMQSQEQHTVTIGDMFGDQLRKVAEGAAEPAGQQAAEAEPEEMPAPEGQTEESDEQRPVSPGEPQSQAEKRSWEPQELPEPPDD